VAVPGDDDDFRAQLSGLLAELAAWDDQVLDGLGGDVLLAAAEALELPGPGESAGAAAAVDDGPTLLDAARDLAASAVRSLLAHRCDVVRGTCPACHRAVAFKGCGQEPDFAPNVADVARLQRFERELAVEDATLRRAQEASARPVADVAEGAARLLEQLGGFGALAALLAPKTPEENPT